MNREEVKKEIARILFYSTQRVDLSDIKVQLNSKGVYDVSERILSFLDDIGYDASHELSGAINE